MWDGVSSAWCGFRSRPHTHTLTHQSSRRAAKLCARIFTSQQKFYNRAEPCHRVKTNHTQGLYIYSTLTTLILVGWTGSWIHIDMRAGENDLSGRHGTRSTDPHPRPRLRNIHATATERSATLAARITPKTVGVRPTNTGGVSYFAGEGEDGAEWSPSLVGQM